MSRSIELRLTSWYAGTLFLGFTVLGVVLWSVVSYSMETSVDARLIERLERIAAAVTAEVAEEEDDGESAEAIVFEIEEELVELVMGFPEGNLAQIRKQSGERVFPDSGSDVRIPWRESGDEPTLETVDVAGVPHRVLARQVSFGGETYHVLLASSQQNVVDVRDRVLTVMAVVIPLALLLCAGGGYYIARAALRPVDDMTATAADITIGHLSRRIPLHGRDDALERLAMTFNEMLARIEASVAKIEQFSADASHELRTPLSVVRTTAELALRHGRTDEGYRADLQVIQDESERLSKLIEVLLTLARGPDEDRVPMEPVSLVDLAADVCRRFKDDAARKGIALELQAPEIDVTIEGNETALSRLLASLVENALAHTEDGTITISLVREEGAVVMSVADTGEGIPADALERVFDRFYRGDSARGRSGGRFGLGLSIARRIAELHHAELRAKSGHGEGATFEIRFDGR